MIISIRGSVLGLGKPAVRVADSLVTIAAAQAAMIASGSTREEADQHIKETVARVLELYDE